MTENDELELKQVLDTNPFLVELDNWGKDLISFVEGRKRLEELEFVLGTDKANFTKYQACIARRKTNWDSYLHPELLPQPFIGDPRAPIWYLLLNPGYSFPDRYDHLGVCPCCGKKLCMANITDEECIFDIGRNRLAALKERQELLLDQLRLKKGAPFYLLDEIFNTLQENQMHNKEGGYRWWKSILFGVNNADGFLFHDCAVQCNAEFVGQKIFVLECAPYHSLNFDMRVLWEESRYTNFWVSLVSWGIKVGKKFIVRSKRVIERINEKGLAIPLANLIRFSGARNVALTRNNLEVKSQDILDVLCQILNDRKKN